MRQTTTGAEFTREETEVIIAALQGVTLKAGKLAELHTLEEWWEIREKAEEILNQWTP